MERFESLVAALADMNDDFAFYDVLVPLDEYQLAIPGLVTIYVTFC